MKTFRYFVFVIFAFLHKSYCENGSNTLYDIIVHNCTLLKTVSQTDLQTFKAQPIIKKCMNWTAINTMRSKNQLDDRNKDNIRCLLYYETLNSICSRMPLAASKAFLQLVTSNVESVTHDIDTVCNTKLSILPEDPSQTHYINNIVKDMATCRYLCLEYHIGESIANELCARSYFLNNFNLTKKLDNEDPDQEMQPIVVNPEPKPSAVIESISPSNNDVHQSPSIGTTQIKSDLTSAVHEPPSIETLVQPAQAPKVDQTNPSHEENIKSSNNSTKDTVAAADISKKQVIETDMDQTILESEETNTDKANQVIQSAVPDTPDKTKITIDGIDPDLTKNDDEDQKLENLDNQKMYEKYNTVSGPQEPPPGNTKNDNHPEVNVPEYDEENRNLIKADDIVEQKNVQPKKPEPVIENIPDRSRVHLSNQYPYEADMDGNSYFFTYFSFTCVAFVIGYVGYHNKQKVLAILLEGRNPRKSHRGRRPNSANYHKLDTNLEEAISSSCSKNTSHIIY